MNLPEVHDIDVLCAYLFDHQSIEHWERARACSQALEERGEIDEAENARPLELAARPQSLGIGASVREMEGRYLL